MLKSNLLFLFVIAPSIVFAQTAGPTQPEVQSFQQADITNMVDVSSGTFQYNILLFNIGGYPVNINYTGSVTMDQEASNVGLGFGLNCGSVTRQVRGLPDDFDGDIVKKKMSLKPNITVGIKLGGSLELVGFDKETAKTLKELKNIANASSVGVGMNVSSMLSYNNISGWTIESSIGAGLSGNSNGFAANAGIGINAGSGSAFGVNPYIGLSFQQEKNKEVESKKSTDANGANKTETRKVKVGPSLSSTYSFNNNTYTPKIDFPFTTLSVDATLKLNGELTLTELGGEIATNYRIQALSTKLIESPAFGAIYADKGKDNLYALMDFNREQDGTMTETKPNLPMAFATPDVYSVAGQGIGGAFELKRNNVFIAFDPKTNSKDHSTPTEMDFGIGKAAHIGGRLEFMHVENTSEKWWDITNPLLENLDFNNLVNSATGSGKNQKVLENTYFKNPSDIMVSNNQLYLTTKMQPISPLLQKMPYVGAITRKNKLEKRNTQFNIAFNDFSNCDREHRLDLITTLTGDEAKLFGLVKGIESYSLNSLPLAGNTVVDRNQGYRKGHHISEITCVKPNGERFVFNIPAYNTLKREVVYSVNDNPQAELQGEIQTVPNLSSYESYSGGKDGYISITETPAYVHSFLLGAKLSANYIDVDDNGPTPNDIGDYVKFNYSKVYEDYYWRSNNETNAGNYEEGLLGNKNDSKANYSEGTKEIWYLHSIETKNEIALFTYSDRLDAYDLNVSSKKLKKLDKIELYTRPQLVTNSPKPYKTVHLEYDYSLCKNVNNNPTQGKLSLKKVYFKNGTSNKGKLNAYEFNYSNFNPSIDDRNIDKWGNYKLATNNPGSLSNKRYPYAIQNNQSGAPLQNANTWASAWLLTEIKTPSGSKINIDYEAHRYGYVQHKRAMEMTPLVGIADMPNPSSLGGSELFAGANPYHTKDYLFFKLKKKIPGTVSGSDADNLVEELYFTDRNDSRYGTIVGNSYGNLYGKMRVMLDNIVSIPEEEIPVYLKVKSVGAFKNGADYEYGFVQLEKDRIKGSDVNQIAHKAWQFSNQVYPKILFGMDASSGIESVIEPKALFNLMSPGISQFKTLVQGGPLLTLRNKGVASNIVLNKSYIRVYDPEEDKIGGSGARVKKITIDDNWQKMTNNIASSKTYTISYDYTTKNAKGDIISSGVAAYEPEHGEDENPWKQPIVFYEKNALMAEKQEYMTTTIGETLFPSASIIYSKVTITQNDVSNTPYMGTGKSVNEFYTYKDFPCFTDETSVQIIREPKLKLQIQAMGSKDYLIAAQGYLVVVNDMHGKAKSEEVFGEKGNLISGKYYKYKHNNSGKLINEVNAVANDGSISQKTLGIETQITGDARKFHTECYSAGLSANIDIDYPPPAVVPSAFPALRFERKFFKSFTLTTFNRQQGILDSVIVIDKGAKLYTVNKLWDAKTGAVLLTESINEFKDPIYNFTMPAHWAYKGMGMSSDNMGANNTSNTLSSVFSTAFMPHILQEGDIVGVTDNNGVGNKYVIENASGNSSGGGSVTYRPLYYNKYFSSTAGYFNAKVIKSGKQNLATTPIGVYTSLVNPVQGGSLVLNNTTKILNATISEFGNPYANACNFCDSLKQINNADDVYIASSNYLGTTKSLGVWQPKAEWKNTNVRNQNLNDIRRDGYIDNFINFWTNSGATWNANTSLPQWQFTSRLSLVNRALNPVENRNPLNIFSSVQPSNFQGLTNAVTNNSRYHENLCESFEDITTACEQNRFSILDKRSSNSLININEAHTGNYSMFTGVSGFQKQFGYQYFDNAYDNTKIQECAPMFSLQTNKDYIFSAWVKVPNAVITTLTYDNTAYVGIQVGAGSAFTAKPSGLIVDGWQRIEFKFTTPASNPTLNLSFSPNTYFDDIRIFPFNANMKSYVYDDKDFSLMAILDENNFATYYEYDNEKNLKRVKRETEKGVVTIQEMNAGLIKK